MKQAITPFTHVIERMKRLLLIVFSIISVTLSASAADGLSADTPWILTDGATFELTQQTHAFKSVYAVFTAPSDGTLSLTTPEVFDLYTDGSYSTQSPVQPEWNGNYSPRAYDLTVTAGTTYYFLANFVMNYGTVSAKFTAGTVPITLVSISPAQGNVLEVGSANISLLFSKKVAVGGAQLIVGGQTVDVVATSNNAYIQVEIKSAMMSLYNKGVVNKGMNIAIRLTGIHADGDESCIYGDNGELTINYTATNKPIELISTNNTPTGTPNAVNTFYSWYMADNEQAQVTFTFDGEIATSGSNAPMATLSYGSAEMEGNYYYSEKLPLILIDKNTLAVDFRGVLRRPVDMIGDDINFGVIQLILNNVHGADGQSAYSSVSGAIGSYGVEFTYQPVNYRPSSEFTPRSGAELDNVRNIELWLSEEGDGVCHFDGVWVKFIKNGVADSVKVTPTIETDPEDANAKILTIAVPYIEADANSEVTVSLANVLTPDGVDHSAIYTATYKLVSGATSIKQPSISGMKNESKAYTIDGRLINQSANHRGLIIINKKKMLKSE